MEYWSLREEGGEPHLFELWLLCGMQVVRQWLSSRDKGKEENIMC